MLALEIVATVAAVVVLVVMAGGGRRRQEKGGGRNCVRRSLPCSSELTVFVGDLELTVYLGAKSSRWS